MSEEHGDEPYKLFVSRIPTKWNEKLMMEHLIECGFGDITRCELFFSRAKQARPEKTRRGYGNICYAFKNDGVCPKGDDCPFSHEIEKEEDTAEVGGGDEEHTGNGLVVFSTKDGMDAALQQSTIYVSHKVVKLSPFISAEDGRDTTTCYAWTKFNCTHGDDCKFEHIGDGACVVVGERYKGRKFQCMSFKKKGKCSKGSLCLFLHGEPKEPKEPKAKSKGKVTEEKGEDDEKDKSNQETEKKGICDNYKKKGKCRKGDSCKYSHTITTGSDNGNDLGKKRKKITGAFLVESRKAAKINLSESNNVVKFD
jgi:hypothetical protein